MKLEEVLPAMREGRVAVWNGIKFSIRKGSPLELDCKGDWVMCTGLPLDGWTLEPEPKVEWPKGSLPWAMEQMKDGEFYRDRIRRRATGDFPNRLMPYDIIAIDWEVVP